MRAAFAATGLAISLAGCVTTGGPVVRPHRGDDNDTKTASDSTNADRLYNTRMELAGAYLGRDRKSVV